MEILVHVSAPSNAADDARYHAQVAAILALQPVSTSSNPTATSVGPAAATIATAASQFTADTRPNRLSDETQSAVTAALPCSLAPADGGQFPQSQSQSLVCHGPGPAPDLHLQRVTSWGTAAPSSEIGPAALAPVPLDCLQQQLPPDSLESLISVIPDSQPSDQEQDEPRARASSFPDFKTISEPGLVPALQSTPKTTGAGPSPTPGPGSGPSSGPGSDPSSDNGYGSRAGQPSKRRRLDAAPKTNQPSTTVHNAPIASSSIPPKYPSTSHSLSLPPNKPEIPQNHKTHASISNLLTSLPIQILPPPPPISTSSFTTHITPTLSMLTQRLKPERIYKPHLQTRSLDPLERGYWNLKITIDQTPTHKPEATTSTTTSKNWDILSFHRFWTFLSDFIGKDARAGWGVWCVAEEDKKSLSHSHSHSNSNSPPSTTSTDPDHPIPTPVKTGSLSLCVKLYAWGEVAMHIYLLLYLASERRVRGMGVEWCDSGEEVVIRMS